jgi:hypothetical protein
MESSPRDPALSSAPVGLLRLDRRVHLEDHPGTVLSHAFTVLLVACGSSHAERPQQGPTISIDASASASQPSEGPPMPILQARSPVLEVPTVAAMPIYIRGFPMHMAITVTSTPELFAGRVARLDHLGVANMHVAFTRRRNGGWAVSHGRARSSRGGLRFLYTPRRARARRAEADALRRRTPSATRAVGGWTLSR